MATSDAKETHHKTKKSNNKQHGAGPEGFDANRTTGSSSRLDRTPRWSSLDQLSAKGLASSRPKAEGGRAPGGVDAQSRAAAGVAPWVGPLDTRLASAGGAPSVHGGPPSQSPAQQHHHSPPVPLRYRTHHHHHSNNHHHHRSIADPAGSTVRKKAQSHDSTRSGSWVDGETSPSLPPLPDFSSAACSSQRTPPFALASSSPVSRAQTSPITAVQHGREKDKALESANQHNYILSSHTHSRQENKLALDRHDHAGRPLPLPKSDYTASRSRPRASSAASATQHSYRTKQLPQLPGSKQSAHNGSETRPSVVRRGSIDDIVPEIGRASLPKHSGGGHQLHYHPSHPSFRKVDGTSMPTQTNAHLMVAPLRSTTSGSMSTMASGDTLVPSAGGSSISVSTTSTATRTTRQLGPKPLIIRNNRTYINDPSLSYPLPVDLQELHRQSLRTLLLFQLLGGPITSPVFAKKPPLRVLEVGCGSGFWSMMCHRYFDQKGYKVSFTGMDVIPLCGSGLDPNSKPDSDMQWKFVQHDVRNLPWPFADGEFDLVMAKDMCLVAGPADQQEIWDENVRVTAPGGVLELWETDHTVRMLRPHAPVAKGRSRSVDEEESSSEEEDDVAKLGVYTITGNTPLSPPTNTFLSDYNGWITKALDKRGLSAVPNTQLGPWLLQEAESLTDISSIRMAVPLSEIRWEREGVGGVVTKGDGKSYIDSSKGKYRAGDAKGGAKTLTDIQTALRRTALETVVGLVHSFEPILRETSGKSQDEWDGWMGKMMNDLMREGGTSWGECLEVGAWSAMKRK